MIKWGRPAIYLSNSNPLDDKNADVAWLLGNCEIVELTRSLLVPVEGGLGGEG